MPLPEDTFEPHKYRRAAKRRAFLWRIRHLRTLIPAVFAAIMLVNAARPASPELVTVAVASADLTAGTSLTTEAVNTVTVPQQVAHQLAIPAAADLDLADTPTARVDIPAGSVITKTLVTPDGLSRMLSPGRVAATILVASPAIVQALNVGDRIDVIAADEHTSRRIAHHATVLPWPNKTTDLQVADYQPDASVLISVTPQEAAQLASIPMTQWLSVVIVPHQ